MPANENEKSRKNAAAKKKSHRPTSNEVPLAVVPDYSGHFPSVYSNYASVSHTSNEVVIDYCMMSMPYNVNLDESRVIAPIVSRIILPPAVAKGLVKALQAQLEKYGETAKHDKLVVPILATQQKRG